VSVYVQSVVRTICYPVFCPFIHSCVFFFLWVFKIIMLLLHFSSFLLTLFSVILYRTLLSFFAFYFLCFCFYFSLHVLSFIFPSLATFCHLFPSFLFDCHLFSIISPLSIWFYFLNYCPLPNRIFLPFFLL